MQILYIVLGVWVGVYWLPWLALIIYLVRKNQDIRLEDLIAMILLTALLGPLVGIRVLYEYCCVNAILDKVVIKKCPKREVWKALGGKPENGP